VIEDPFSGEVRPGCDEDCDLCEIGKNENVLYKRFQCSRVANNVIYPMILLTSGRIALSPAMRT